MNIYFVRHGETEENKKKAYYGKMDISLNECGIEQGNKTSNFLKHIKFNRAYISERIRTHEMANLILKNNKCKIIEDKRINEMNLGIFEGKTYSEIENLYPEQWELWKIKWKEYAPPHGESYNMVYNRVNSFMKEIEECNEENIVVVTHGGIIRTVYCYILGGNLDFFWRFASKNGDVTLIKYEYGNWFIDSITHIN
ncbi:MAG: alpha-ribazole phosphatase [Clostridiaceae bacterium]|jgi:alpha-ribazole phosphatase|nr:alpha-ribazole phosphatase [Clostridiaceae bacterium]